MTYAPFITPNRTWHTKPGRAKTSGGTIYYHLPAGPAGSIANTSTITASAGTDYYFSFYVTAPLVFDQMALEVTTGVAGNVRMGIYAADTDLQPFGAPLVDSGDIACITTGVKTYTPGTPVALAVGRYLTVLNCSVGAAFRVWAPTVNGGPFIGTGMGTSNSSALFIVSRAYAAFPTPGTAWTGFVTPSGSVPLLRVTSQ